MRTLNTTFDLSNRRGGRGFHGEDRNETKNLEYLKCEIEQTKKGINKQNFFYYMEDERAFSLSLSLSGRYLLQFAFNFPRDIATSSKLTVRTHALPFIFLYIKNNIRNYCSVGN